MYKARRNTQPDVPHSVQELYDEMVKDSPFVDQFGRLDGDLMCHGISGPPGHQSILFTTKAMLNVLLAASWLFMDGTFSARPDCPPSRQLLVISALHLDCVSVFFVDLETFLNLPFKTCVFHALAALPRLLRSHGVED